MVIMISPIHEFSGIGDYWEIPILGGFTILFNIHDRYQGASGMPRQRRGGPIQILDGALPDLAAFLLQKDETFRG
ncbi:hypothetical protein GL267_014765 [Acidithiobacillus ferrianus]|uniref:Uncharacterized protein n=2 Tax=Acidithiobacillus ferrianus TaxID=2678518 RepID=A0A845UM30_9PROT|nr:hypothetical protein [Acidithiobacillus ferrianus]NDU42678.1 hypothetical protein [Acidithiobacillus ferrianus]